MADTLTTAAINNNLLPNFFVPTALATLYNKTPLYEFAQKDAQPGKKGSTTYWNAWVRMAGASSSLVEGVANSLVALSSRRVSAVIDQYGRGLKITDLAEFMLLLDPKSGGREVVEEAAQETLEYIAQMGVFKPSILKNRRKTTNLSSYMSSQASAFCAITGVHTISDLQFGFPAVFGTSCLTLSAVNKSAPSTSAQLSVASLRKVKVSLENALARPFDDGNFVAYASPNALATLRKDPTWTDWNKYQNAKTTMYKGEEGMVEGFRFVKSTLAPSYRVAAHSVNMVFCFGKQAFGVTDIMGGLEYFVTDGPDKADPFNQFMTMTFKISAAAAPLNASAGRILFVHEKL